MVNLGGDEPTNTYSPQEDMVVKLQAVVLLRREGSRASGLKGDEKTGLADKVFHGWNLSDPQDSGIVLCLKVLMLLVTTKVTTYISDLFDYDNVLCDGRSSLGAVDKHLLTPDRGE